MDCLPGDTSCTGGEMTKELYAALIEDIIKISDEGNADSGMDDVEHDLRECVDGTFGSLSAILPMDMARFVCVYMVSGWRAAERFYHIKEKQ